MSILEKFIEDSNGCTTQHQLFELYTGILSEFGFGSAVYTFMTDHPSVSQKAGHGVQSNYPSDWMGHYQEKSYHLIDPVVRTGLASNVPFRWRSLAERLSLSTEQKQFMLEAEEAGLKSGIGIPLHRANGEIAGVGIASDSEIVLDNITLAKLNLLTQQFHTVYCDMENPSGWNTLEQVILTNREKEILKWLACGKSYQDIADILVCSRSTVRFHLGNCYKKLQANDKIFAITKAIRMGLIPLDTVGLPTFLK
jgi:DNA-binding CsgD family transcriptional regulator